MGRDGIWLLVSDPGTLSNLVWMLTGAGIWRSREDARLGGTGPWHKRARGAARELYERIEFTTLKLVVGEAVGTWSIAEWEEA